MGIAYHNYDMCGSSNHPDKKVTVSGAGTSASWTTNSSGSADGTSARGGRQHGIC
jgi:hypothetical protein